MRQGRATKGMSHARQCRDRIELRLKEVDDPRIAASRDRFDAEMAKRLERQEGGAIPQQLPLPVRPQPQEEEENGDVTPRLPARNRDGAPYDEGELVIDGDPGGLDVDDDDMINLLDAGMPEETAKEYLNLYELFLVQGVARGVAKAKVAELFSPPRISEEIRRLPNLGIVGGMTYDLFEGADGRTFDFRRAADRAQVRREISEQRPFMFVGSPPTDELQ